MSGELYEFKCEECGYTALTSDDCFECSECCEHDDHDGHCCLICGKDVQEDLMCAAEWAYDAARGH